MLRQGHNTPIPLERSPPASFKRLLGRDSETTFVTKQPYQGDAREDQDHREYTEEHYEHHDFRRSLEAKGVSDLEELGTNYAKKGATVNEDGAECEAEQNG